jgi:hypothetical protein
MNKIIPKALLKKLDPKGTDVFKNKIKDIFSWSELEHLLNFRPYINNKRFIMANCFNYEDYVWRNEAWLTDVNSWDPDVLSKAIKKHVCGIVDASRVNPKINQICKELEEHFNLTTDAHIYFSLIKKHKEGFGAHWDKSDNMIVQVEGKTRFKVWNKTNESVTDKKDLKKESIILDEVLEKGDVIWIPSHVWHEAISLEKRISISFPCFKSSLPSQNRKWIKLSE